MRTIKFISLLFLLMAGVALSVNASENSSSLALQGDYLESTGDSVWKMGDALLVDGSQITTNNYEPGFPPSNLLRPESEGVGTNQIIWHTSWSYPAAANTDTYLQMHFNKGERNIIFTMIGSNWIATYDTPTEVIIQAANLPGEWKEVAHLKDMQYDFIATSPDRYTSPHIDLGAEYTDIRFVVKNTVTAASGRRDRNGNPFVSLGRFQVYRAVKGIADPVDKKANINLLFIGNSITYGAGLSTPDTQAPPAVCRSLVENATGITTNVYNGGHSGITTLGFLPGRDDFSRVVSAAKALQRNNGGNVYFSIMLGTNDSAISGPEGSPVNTNTYQANMKAIIEKLIEQVPDCKILLNYPIWYSPNTHNGGKYLQEGLDRLRSYYPIIDALVDEYDQVYAGNRNVWDYFEDNLSLFIAESGYSGTFFLHPNATGAARLAEVWSKSLLDIIATDSIEIKNPLPEWNFFKSDNNKKYTISTPRGFYGVKGDIVVNTVKTSVGATKGEFALINYENKLYVYSVSAKKFFYRNPKTDGNGWSNILLSNSIIEPFKVQYVGVNSNYLYSLTSLGYITNVGSNTEYGVVLNGWNGSDAGNQVKIIESGDFDPTEAIKILQDYFANQLTVTYRVEDAEGNLLEEYTGEGQDGDVISEIPAGAKRRAYTTYTVPQPVTLANGQENVVRVVATWKLPFEVSSDINNAHWYNLTLREGVDYVTSDNGYKCNTAATQSAAMKNSYQWAFQGDPYNGIVVYNRADTTKTLAKVDDKAKLASGTYLWQLVEGINGFLLANNENGYYINEYGGPGRDLGFWYNVEDVGSIFNVSEVGSMPVKNVSLPSGATLKIFKASDEKANGRAVLVFPGGGYGFIAGGNEGSYWAPFFNDLGYTVAVLTYTVPPTSPEGPLTQARDAMRYLRENGEELKVTTGIVGVMGFSAGGHLASTVATHTFGDEAPAFQILFYPVITMDASYTHIGSRDNLIGSNPSASLVELYSNEKQVKATTPMAYLCWADNDGTVSPKNSTEYIKALNANGVPVHSINFTSGGHGYGFGLSYSFHDEMLEDMTNWMKSIDSALTSIDAPTVTENDENYYDLSGKRVKNPKRGIFVKDGRKFFVK